ncbi:ATP-dependent helicase/nuclease subunit A [Halobiforma haloterrestris]|uniref:DNA 3'-5' helicase n=1 Tax=Natronobacterium haloterrestre TaxID=148448 RepID=A0A1I1KC93_NATHA|nr:UvrD-helicase domain-containing protein [Halobiforma haloterrestris]SFC57912.1 ATP-dependent helicase/nuclease subunit A [Halobiforma haloterrestris]
MSDDDAFTLEPEQQAAARTFDRNVSVEAGAGTGKTTTLTERYVTILRAHIDGPETLAEDVDDGEPSYRIPDDITRISDPEEARRLPERIVVTTFTERAAEDLKASIRSKLRDHLDEIDDPNRWELWRAAADGVESSYVHTIHGFCNRILQEYAISTSGVDPQFEVIEEDDAGLLAATVVTELIEEEPPEVRTLAPLFDRSRLGEVLSGLISEREMTEAWIDDFDRFEDETEYEAFLVSIHPFSADPETMLEEVMSDVETLCEILQDDAVCDRIGTRSMKSVGRPLQEWFDRASRVPVESLTPFERLSLCIDLCDALTNGDNEAYAEGTYFGNKGFRTGSGDVEAQYSEAMTAVLAAVGPAGQPIDSDIAPDREAYELLRSLASLTRTALDRYDRRKERRGVLDYDDLIRLTIDFLENGDQTEVERLRSDLHYVMVDEFQDTNDLQWRLVKALVSSSTVRDSSTGRPFDADNVFIVGDSKQSIYRFRDADVTVFDTARDTLRTANVRHGTPDDGPPLATNFRTLPKPLGAINGLFDHVFEYGGQEPFEAVAGPLRAGRENNQQIDPIVEYVPVPVDDDLRDRLLKPNHDLHELPESEPADIEATAIASRLVELLNGDVRVTADDADSGDKTNVVESDGRGRRVEPDDVAVLIRSRSDLKDYERALRAASIPYTVVKGEGFFETPEIRAFVSLFRALADPSDEVTLYAALRSPLCGLSDETIARVHEPGTSLWENLRTTDVEDVRSVAEDIQRWREYAGTADSTTRSRVGSWVELADRIVEETGYLVSITADERGVAAVANVDKFREKLREFDVAGVPSLDRVVARLNEQSEQGRTEAEANVAAEGSGVRIMTIHEAKGQEFPVVVVPGVSKGFTDRGRIANGSVEFELVPIDGERRPVLGLNVPGDWGEDDEGTLLRDIARERRRAEERAEEKRVLYVGCTRAEDHLILTGQHTSDSDSETGVTPPVPTEAGSMRDWIQPTLFGVEDDAVESWTKLEEDGRFTTELDYQLDGETGTGEFTVRLPPVTGTYDGDVEQIEPQTQRSRYEYELPWEIRLSPSALTGLEDGSVELTVDDVERCIRPTTTEKAETRETSDRSPSDEQPGISAAFFGQAVHRLCEVRPPRQTWRSFIEQVFAEERSVDSDEILQASSGDLDAIEGAAECAITFVEDLHEQSETLATYDEFPIELTFPNGELQGYIDHLVVTPDQYHVVDYKTDRKGDDETIEEFLDRRAAHHEPQVMAYAASLMQADPERDVLVTLFFTDADRTHTWEPNDVEDAYEVTTEKIRSAVHEAIMNAGSLINAQLSTDL